MDNNLLIKLNELECILKENKIKNISRVFYVKVKYSNLTIKLLEQKVYGPVLDIGNKEDFDSHGVMPSWIIKKENN